LSVQLYLGFHISLFAPRRSRPSEELPPSGFGLLCFFLPRGPFFCLETLFCRNVADVPFVFPFGVLAASGVNKNYLQFSSPLSPVGDRSFPPSNSFSVAGVRAVVFSGGHGCEPFFLKVLTPFRPLCCGPSSFLYKSGPFSARRFTFPFLLEILMLLRCWTLFFFFFLLCCCESPVIPPTQTRGATRAT